MKELARWQIVSFLSRGGAMFLGLVQGVFVVRILTVSEYGLVGIVAAIGSIVGVTQHLGLASGSTREISTAKDNAAVFKVFVTSVVIRYLVTFPLAIVLFVLAPTLAYEKYSQPELLTPLRLYAIVLLLQGVQSIFNSVISGTQRFKQLFIYQVAIALVSVLLYIPLVYFFKVNGYFLALLCFNLVASITLGLIALWPFRHDFEFPSILELKLLLKELLSISLGIYAVKVIYTFWQRVGQLILGDIDIATVGVFSFALFYATKLMSISDAVTDVNLPALSKQYVNDIESFKRVFSSNFDKVFSFIVFSALSAVFWVNEIVWIAVGSDKYAASLPLVLPMVFAFVFYSFVNIIKSSVIIPAKLIREMLLGYLCLLIGTVLPYYLFRESLGVLVSMVLGMCIGSLAALVFLTYIAQKKLNFSFFGISHVLLLAQAFAIAYSGGISNIFVKIMVYIVFSALFLFGLYSASFINKEHLAFLMQKLRIYRGGTIDE